MMTAEQAFAELDNLAAADVADDQSERGAGRMLDVMEELLATSPAALAGLITRYSTSQSHAMRRTVAFCLAQSADHRDEASSNLVFAMAEAVLDSSDASTLINCLTAIHRQSMHRRAWTPREKTPAVLVDFFVHCLAQSVVVQDTAIDVLGKLKVSSWLALLSNDELERLRVALRQTDPESVYQPGLETLRDL